jgi:phosphate/phosphite/phosphonate ABC transporter binding protein
MRAALLRKVFAATGRIAALASLALLPGAGCGDSPHRSAEVVTLSAEQGRAVIRVVCSDEVYPAFTRLAFEYSSRHPVTFDVFHAQSAKVPEVLREGGAELGVTGRNLSARAGELGMVYVPLAYDGAVFLVSGDTGVTSLTSAQVRRLYDGQLRNWKEVGGKDLPVRVVDRPRESSIRLALAASLFRGDLPASPESIRFETSESACYAMQGMSGYIAFAPLSRTVVDPFPCVPISVDGYPPLAAGIGKKPYPSRLEYGFVFRRDAAKELKDFVNHLLSTEGVHQVAALGLLPAVESLSLAACHCRATEGAYSPAQAGALAGTFSLAIVPELGAIEQEKRYTGIARSIADGMEVNIQVRHLGSYDDMVREFAEGRIDGAFVGSFVYAVLHRRFGIVPVARPESGGVSSYRGILLVPAKSKARSAADLKGKSAAYVERTSAGELFLTAAARGEGSTPERFFGRLVKVPSHADAVRLLAEGKVDCAFTKDLVFRRLVLADPSVGAALRVVATSPPFPENALVAAPTLSPRQRQKLSELLVGLPRTEAGRKALARLGAERFLPTFDNDYAAVYSLAGKVGIDLAAAGKGK